ncbi:MAG: hypothetical protein LBE92_09870 [Chryseobacterium sp.]|jgi:hypothetical protein|uniref:hypothetical protein n=1 Tax=Chryseobacterium sp. TaxID=1871047 RepID=UPI002827BE3E|nr:hypothetical protein [Chryseobacterium sp.]MDR2236421.1 hypothetical protein [Chryseobacterium sp.]
MSTNRRVLEKMSDHELEQYIQPESRFVPEAVMYAAEILKSRGRSFTEEENARINSVVSGIKNEATDIHPDYKKVANIFYLCGALGIASMIWTYEQFNTPLGWFIGTAVIAFTFALGYFAGKGNQLVRYFIIISFALGCFGLPFIPITLKTDPVLGVLNIIQILLQIWAIIVLLRIPGSKKAETSI